jgi:hypothetical protein
LKPPFSKDPLMKITARVVGRAKTDPNKRVVVDHKHLRDADFSGRELMKFTDVFNGLFYGSGS